MLYRFFALSVFVLGLAACGSDTFTPKPHAFPRVNYPERHYVAFDTNFCSFSFELPDYMNVVQDTSFFEEKPANPCWFNLEMPAFNGTVHFTYTPVKNQDDVYKVIDDAYRLAAEHNRKAAANTDYIINNPESNVYGVLFEIEGYAASQFQFVVTDSVQHALRGALYFKSQPQPDSLAPIIEFVRTDMVHILNTIKWR